MGLTRLSYTSSASSPLRQSDIEALEAQADARNRALQITGVLLFDGACFYQVLEGPDAAVSDLMNSIARDPRHAGILYLSHEPITERLFPAWGMRLVTYDELDVLVGKTGALTLPAERSGTTRPQQER